MLACDLFQVVDAANQLDGMAEPARGIPFSKRRNRKKFLWLSSPSQWFDKAISSYGDKLLLSLLCLVWQSLAAMRLDLFKRSTPKKTGERGCRNLLPRH